MSLPFLLDLHNEVSGSWEHPFSYSALNYSNIDGLCELGYGRMPRLEINLVNYLSLRTSSSMKATVLPSKPCQMASGLVGKVYLTAGHGALHIMPVLQAYQADLLKDLDQVRGFPLRLSPDCAWPRISLSALPGRQLIPLDDL